MAIHRLLVVILFLLAGGFHRALAGELNPQQLDGLGRVVETICKTITEAKGSSTKTQIEGTIQADLPSLLKKFLNIDVSSTGKIGNETYEGLSREATATAMENSLQCRERLFTKMLDKLGGSPAINLSGTGIASGGDVLISAPVQIGLNEEKTAHAVNETMRPLSRNIELILAAVSQDKGVPVAALQAIVQKAGGAGVNVPERDVPKLLELLDKMADEVVALREQMARAKTIPGLAQAQVALDHGDLADVDGLLKYWEIIASDKYDKRLRDKMEEWTLQTQLEAAALSRDGQKGRHQRQAQKQRTPKVNVVSAEELQILIKQWKTVTDLTSNLSKDINDMAMTAVHNLR